MGNRQLKSGSILPVHIPDLKTQTHLREVDESRSTKPKPGRPSPGGKVKLNNTLWAGAFSLISALKTRGKIAQWILNG